jgi:hypothetical protein
MPFSATAESYCFTESYIGQGAPSKAARDVKPRVTLNADLDALVQRFIKQ